MASTKPITALASPTKTGASLSAWPLPSSPPAGLLDLADLPALDQG